MQLDLNCDLGEGCPFDAEIMPLITSANVSCGFHAGDPSSARTALRLAAEHNVQAGAHPGYADRDSLGRREQTRTEEQIFEECIYQVGALTALAKAEGITLRYLKPHGALYNQACRDDAYARPVVRAAELLELAVMGLPQSRLREAAAGRVPFIAEGFADRRYRPDGTLVPRTEPDAFVADADEAVRQAEWLLTSRGIRTICVHGDNPHALEFVRRLREALTRKGVALRAF